MIAVCLSPTLCKVEEILWLRAVFLFGCRWRVPSVSRWCSSAKKFVVASIRWCRILETFNPTLTVGGISSKNDMYVLDIV